MFDKNGRVEHVDDGLRFYEQDIVMGSYIFSEKRVVVDVVVDYVSPGFGLAIDCRKDGNSNIDGATTYLAKIGAGSFQVYRRTVEELPKRLHSEACLLLPGGSQRNLRFTIRRTKITLEEKAEGSYTKVGEFTLPVQLDTYRLGVYSSPGNTLKSISFLVDMPDNWVANVANTFGGRISFKLDGFTFENCLHDAEVEQDRVSLKAGKYYVRYSKEDVNGMNDIECYVFRSKSDIEGEASIEDDKKQLITKSGTFVLHEPTEVDIKFKGTSGSISNISLTDLPGGSYVRTYSEPESHDGSSIIIALENVSRVDWVGIVSDVPKWDDMTQDIPYCIASVGKKTLSKDAAGIDLGTRYKFSYDAIAGTLTTYEDVNINSTVSLPSDNAEDILTIFHGVSGVITSLIVTTKGGQSIDTLLSQSAKVYVPQTIKSPIIVMSNDYGPYDLSSSYREVIIPHKKVEVFSKSRPLELKERIVTSIHAPHVYGIPKGARIDQTANEIRDVCKSAVEISGGSYSFERNVLSIDPKVRERFSHLAVEYDSIKDYYYWFTNIEREVFDGDELIFPLASLLRQSNNAVTVYGIPKDADIEEEMFFRVPNKGMLHSIDIYANKYETLPHSMYDVYYDSNSVSLDRSLKGKYKQYIVEYEKGKSYCVNLVSSMGQYEVEFFSDGDAPYVVYDQHEDGSISGYVNTGIQPDKNKYIVLRRTEEAS